MGVHRILRCLFSACLNQDFDLIFGTADDAIRAFFDHGSRDEVLAAIEEIRAIVNMNLQESEAQKLILEDLGSCYYYPADWPSAALWLNHVVGLLGG